MKIEEVSYVNLLDLYKGMLTPNKAEIAEMYFSCDLSLTEIAEIKNCTRQSVLDAIKTIKNELDTFEKAIGYDAYRRKIAEFYETLSEEGKQTFKGILEK